MEKTMNTTVTSATHELSSATAQTPVIQGDILAGVISDPTEEELTLNSPKRLARIAGVLYLLVGIFGGFAEGFVEPKMYVPGDAATTASNLLANSGLVRIGVVADLFQATVMVFLGLTLYMLLKHVHKIAAIAM